MGAHSSYPVRVSTGRTGDCPTGSGRRGREDAGRFGEALADEGLVVPVAGDARRRVMPSGPSSQTTLSVYKVMDEEHAHPPAHVSFRASLAVPCHPQ